jgi:peroxiredoxin
VVMVFYWSTECAVCRTKLPELRANLAGWANKPFDLVTVSTDRREADWRQYEQVKALTQAAAAQRGVALWGGAPTFSHSLKALPSKLPLTLVLDANGVERYRVEGHVPPEVWDKVAELIP